MKQIFLALSLLVSLSAKPCMAMQTTVTVTQVGPYQIANPYGFSPQLLVVTAVLASVLFNTYLNPSQNPSPEIQESILDEAFEEFITGESQLSPVDILRGVQAPESRIAKARRILRTLKEKYKSSEDYDPSVNCPIMNEFILIELLRDYKLDPIKNSLIHFIIKSAYSRMMTNLIAKQGRVKVPDIAAGAALSRLIGHGECGELSSLLIVQLMEAGFENIDRYIIVEKKIGSDIVDHGFVVVEDENGVAFALDTFFNVVMPLEDFLSSDAFLSYFRRSLENPEWVFSESSVHSKKSYKKSEYQLSLKKLLQQIEMIKEASENDKEMQTFRDQIRHIQEARHVDELMDLVVMWIIGDESIRHSCDFERVALEKDTAQIQKRKHASEVFKNLLYVLSLTVGIFEKNWVIDFDNNAAWLKVPLSQKENASIFQKMLSTFKIKIDLQIKEKSCFMIVRGIKTEEESLELRRKILTLIVDSTRIAKKILGQK